MAEHQREGIQNLIGDALRDATDLARKEVALFKAELSDNMRKLLMGIAMIAAAGVFALVAIILFTAALVDWLAVKVGSEALANLIVGAVMAAVAVGLVLYGRSAMSTASLVPQRSVRSIQRDTTVLSESVAG